MSEEDLRVTPAHLRDLAASHSLAAAAIASATETASGVDRSIHTSHGAIAWSTARALEAMHEVRRDAGYSVACESEALRRNLISAADRYGATDQASGAVLDQARTLVPAMPTPR